MSPERTPNEARQGEKVGNMRYVLLISTGAAAIILLTLFFIWS